MVSINPENVIKTAESGLKKKAFGGVSLESAKEAIQKTADGVKQLAENAIGSVQQELQNFKGKSAQEMAEMTSKKDAVILGKDEQIKDLSKDLEKSNKIITKLKSNFTWGKPKETKRGTIVITRSNKNGARMELEMTKPDTDARASLLKVTVTNNDGDVRKTAFKLNEAKMKKDIKYKKTSNEPENINLEIGTRKSTYTNVNEETTLKYDNDGKLKSKDLVNVKKSSVQKPKLLSEDIISSDTRTGIDNIKKTYSDGSYQMIEYSKSAQTPLASEKFNKEGKLVEKARTTLDNSGKVASTTTEKLNPETGKSVEIINQYADGTSSRKLFNEEGKFYKKEEKTKQGLKRIITAKTDKYGNVDDSNPTLKYVYPKESLIKSSTVELESRYYANKEVLKMKDGSTVTMGINNNYTPYNVTINKQGEAPKVLEREEGAEYLKKIGKVGYRQDEDYFSNVLR